MLCESFKRNGRRCGNPWKEISCGFKVCHKHMRPYETSRDGLKNISALDKEQIREEVTVDVVKKMSKEMKLLLESGVEDIKKTQEDQNSSLSKIIEESTREVTEEVSKVSPGNHLHIYNFVCTNEDLAQKLINSCREIGIPVGDYNSVLDTITTGKNRPSSNGFIEMINKLHSTGKFSRDECKLLGSKIDIPLVFEDEENPRKRSRSVNNFDYDESFENEKKKAKMNSSE